LWEGCRSSGVTPVPSGIRFPSKQVKEEGLASGVRATGASICRGEVQIAVGGGGGGERGEQR